MEIFKNPLLRRQIGEFEDRWKKIFETTFDVLREPNDAYDFGENKSTTEGNMFYTISDAKWEPVIHSLRSNPSGLHPVEVSVRYRHLKNAAWPLGGGNADSEIHILTYKFDLALLPDTSVAQVPEYTSAGRLVRSGITGKIAIPSEPDRLVYDPYIQRDIVSSTDHTFGGFPHDPKTRPFLNFKSPPGVDIRGILVRMLRDDLRHLMMKYIMWNLDDIQISMSFPWRVKIEIREPPLDSWKKVSRSEQKRKKRRKRRKTRSKVRSRRSRRKRY